MPRSNPRGKKKKGWFGRGAKKGGKGAGKPSSEREKKKNRVVYLSLGGKKGAWSVGQEGGQRDHEYLTICPPGRERRQNPGEGRKDKRTRRCQLRATINFLGGGGKKKKIGMEKKKKKQEGRYTSFRKEP